MTRDPNASTADSGIPNTDRDRAIAVRQLADHWPGEGQHHQPYLALAGGLLRDGFTVAQAETIISELCEATSRPKKFEPKRGWCEMRPSRRDHLGGRNNR